MHFKGSVETLRWRCLWTDYSGSLFKPCLLAAAKPRMLKEGKRGRGQGHVTPQLFGC